MAKREQLFRLFDIIEILKKNPKGATYDEVKSFIDRQHQSRQDIASEVPFSEKTFKRDRNMIFDLFAIETKYRRSTNTYQIDENDDLDGAAQIYDNLLLVNAYRKTKNQADIMLFERRQASGLHNLEGLIYAIKHHKVISFTYQKHWEDAPVKRVVEPYAVKEFKNRWYLLAADSESESAFIKTFGLDRMTDLDIKSKIFQEKKVDLQLMFDNSFGIIATGGEFPQRIVLSFDHLQGKYIKTMPLHPSQNVITDSPDEYRIEVTLCPTYDFYQELLTHAEALTVVEPEAVKMEYTEFLKIALEKNR